MIEREGSFDQVRKLVRKEGIEAKNLVSYHVPLNETLSIDTSPPLESEGAEKDKNESPKECGDPGKGIVSTSAVSGQIKGNARKADFRARHWSYLFDNLRRTVDAIYDTCYFDESVVECKEAIMVLENCTKDFQALIEYFNSQAAWEKSEKRTPIAWEVRKTAGSPNKHFIPEIASESSQKDAAKGNVETLKKAVEDAPNGTMSSNAQIMPKAGPFARGRRRPRCQIPFQGTLVLETIVLPVAKNSIQSSQSENVPEGSNAPTANDIAMNENQVSVLETAKADEGELKENWSHDDTGVVDEDAKANDDDGWEIVCYTRGRRNSGGKSDKLAHVQSSQVNDSPHVDSKQQSKFDGQAQSRLMQKLQPAVNQRPTRTSIFPRNAQEIRQTKASLGKMAYNRQYLADQRQKELEDKMKIVVDSRSAINNRRRAFATSGSSISLPSLNNLIGINFSDPEVVKRTAQAMKAAILKNGGRSRRVRSYQSMESVQSLESIKEEESYAVDKETAVKANGSATLAQHECEVQVLLPDEANDQIAAVIEMKVDAPDGQFALDTFEQPAALATDGLDEHRESCRECTFPVEATFKETSTPIQELADVDPDETWKHLTEEEESLAQEEESIQKEMEEERKSIDIEMQRQIMDDDADEDDIGVEGKETRSKMSEDSRLAPTINAKPMSWKELVERWEAEPKLSWAEMVELEEMEKVVEVRSPGQAVHVHEKLSSPSRQRNLNDDIKKREERRAKANEMRQLLLEGRHQRMRELSKRVQEVQEARRHLVEKKKAIMEERLAKAEENRTLLLMARVKKAHDEEEKVNEIAFINTLEADNKRLDVMTRQQDLESRLQSIQDGRLRRSEEKAAREAAAEERRKAAEEQRQLRLLDQAERTRRRQEQIEQQRSEQERERQQLAKDKAREREGRLAGLKAVKQANTEELLQRIQHKQEESTRRHEENLEQIKQRASEMSTPRSSGCVGGDVSSALETLRPPSCQPYSKPKLCTVCNMLIPSDVHLLAHLKGKRHDGSLKDVVPGKSLTKESTEQENQKCIVEATDDKVQALSPSTALATDRIRSNRKRRQRLRQKLQAKVKEYATNVSKPQTSTWRSSSHLQKMLKAQRDIGRCLETCGLDKQWLSADVHTLERAVGELTRIMSQQGCEKEQEAFHGCKIQDQALLLLSVLEKQNACDVTRLPLRSLLNVCNMLKVSITNNAATCSEMLYSNRIGACVDALALQLQNLKPSHANVKQPATHNQKAIPQETVVLQLSSLLISNLDMISNVLIKGAFDGCHGGEDGFRSRVSLMLSYIVASGIVDQLGAYCAAIVDLPREGGQYDIVYGGFQLINAALKVLLLNGKPMTVAEDATQLLEAVRCTELCNLMPILYSTLLGPNMVSSTDRQTPPKLADSIVSLVEASLDFINCTGAASRQLLQDILGQEGSSLEFRHVASFLISYGNRYDCQSILHRIILSVGHFTVLNAENQALVHFGNQPSILQQLCVLPFAYFSDKKLIRILFPTLIACSYRSAANRHLCEQELSCVLLSDFLKQKSVDNGKSSWSGSEDWLYSLEWRFPKEEWTRTVEYFESPLAE